MVSMTDIASLSNSFGTTFGLHGNHRFVGYDKENKRDVFVLELTKEDYLTDEEAKKVFDLVVEAFKIGSDKTYLERNRLSFEFDRENLKIIEYQEMNF